MSNLAKMIRYASVKHQNQKRRTGRPYFRDHCLALLEGVCNDWTYGDDEIAHLIILGHDIVEDCTENDTDEERQVLYTEIRDLFGSDVAVGIGELTNEFTKKRYPDMNRRKRKAAELKRLRGISDRGKVLKLYDRRINLQDMVDVEDRNITYAQESWDLAFALGSQNNHQVSILVTTLAARLRDRKANA